MELEREILELAALVERLRSEDTDLRVFGADSHEYHLGPKLTEAEIQNFEQEHGIVLPEDYRLWLQLVGNGSGEEGDWANGGLGPDHGIYHLQRTARETRPEKPFQPSLNLNPFRKVDHDVFNVESDDKGYIFGVLYLRRPISSASYI